MYMANPKLTPEERFKKFLSDPVEGKDSTLCVLWLGAKNKSGHGVFWNSSRLIGAHKFSLQQHLGICVMSGYDVAHGPCHNPSCVNPHHLSIKTCKGNMHDTIRDGTRANMSRSGEMHPQFGKRGALSHMHGRKRHDGAGAHARPVVGVHAQLGHEIAFNSIADAARSLRINRHSINNNLQSRSKSAGGYRWTYSDRKDFEENS